MSTEIGPNGKAELTVSDGVAELRLTDPEKRNCFSPELGEDVLTLMLDIEEHDVSAVVLTSEGEAFCAGLDLSILQGDDDERRGYMFELLGAVTDWLYWSDVPVVVGADGAAPGGGSIIIDACDIRVAGEELSMWWPEVAFGVSGHHIAARLVSQVGWPRATELMLMGNERPVGAEEARDIGLVNRVVDSDDVEETAHEIADVIAAHDDAHDNITSHLEAIQHAREELQGASQVYSRSLAQDFEGTLRR